MENNSILVDVWKEIQENQSLIPEITEIKVGKFYIAVFTENSAGIAYRSDKHQDIPHFSKTQDLINRTIYSNSFDRAICTAALSALCSIDIRKRYRVEEGDPLDNCNFIDKVMTTIGRFPPLVDKYKTIVKELRVIERKYLKEPGINYYSPDQANKALNGSDVVIITGSSLIFGGIEEYIKQASRKCKDIIILGPSSSLYPGPFFGRGASCVGGIEITNREKLALAIKDSGTQTILKCCAKKIFTCI